jgi:hypothetical protein
MKLRSVQVGVVDASLSAVGLLCLAAGACFVVDRELSLAVTALGAAVVLLFAATIDRFEFLKGWGIEARTKNLNATLDRAEFAIKQLKELAEISGGELIALNSSAGRIRAPSVSESYLLSRKVKGVLTRLGSSSELIATALTPWAHMAASDLFYEYGDRLRKLLEERSAALSATIQNLPPEEQTALGKRLGDAQQYRNDVLLGMSKWPLEAFPGKVVRMLEDVPLLDEEIRVANRPDFARAAAEFRYLASNLDVSDHDLWTQVRRDG